MPLPKLNKIITYVLGMFLIIFSVQCDSILNDKSTLDIVEVFEDSRVILFTDTEIACPDSIITIIMQCYPIYSGKDRVILQVISGDSVFVESPLRDSLRGTSLANKAQYQTEFSAAQSFFQEWKVRLKQNKTGYTFEGYVYLDSLTVSVSIPEGSTFKNCASSECILYLLPPSKH